MFILNHTVLLYCNTPYYTMGVLISLCVPYMLSATRVEVPLTAGSPSAKQEAPKKGHCEELEARGKRSARYCRALNS